MNELLMFIWYVGFLYTMGCSFAIPEPDISILAKIIGMILVTIVLLFSWPIALGYLHMDEKLHK